MYVSKQHHCIGHCAAKMGLRVRLCPELVHKYRGLNYAQIKGRVCTDVDVLYHIGYHLLTDVCESCAILVQGSIRSTFPHV